MAATACLAWNRGRRLKSSRTVCGGDMTILTARSQGQACSAASNEVVQGVIWLLTDLGTDTGGEAKHSSDSSCKGRWGLKVGKWRRC